MTNSIKLTLDGKVYEYPVDVCQIMPGFALAQGKDGESGIAIKADITQVVASFQYYFEEDGVRLWDSWDSQRDVQKTIKGSTISASGTMKRIGRREFKAPDWEYLQGIETIEAPFTITASCKK